MKVLTLINMKKLIVVLIFKWFFDNILLKIELNNTYVKSWNFRIKILQDWGFFKYLNAKFIFVIWDWLLQLYTTFC